MPLFETRRVVQHEIAKVSLIGQRAENQDRVETMTDHSGALLIVVDGMGGHAEGARASEVTVDCVAGLFREVGHPVLDPQGFLIRALTLAHDEVVGLGAGIPVEKRPRATCALCLLQDANAYCAHIGDSRIYQLRHGEIVYRSRDHSHVQLLLHEGVIEEEEISNHPMRNYVECCLGGDPALPDMTVAARRHVFAGDVILLCTDGLWSGIEDEALRSLTSASGELDRALHSLAERAVAHNAPGSDNTSAVAMLVRGWQS